MFDLVPWDATEGTVRATKLCLSAAGGCVTFTLPLTVATWQPTTGCRTFLIGSSPVNKAGGPDKLGGWITCHCETAWTVSPALLFGAGLWWLFFKIL